MPRKSEIESLVLLLDDPDPGVHGAAKKRLFELGERAVPLLDEQKSTASNENERTLINDIIRHITYSHVREDFVDILDGGIQNPKQLERAVLILSRFENPTLRIKDYERKLDHFAETVADEIRFQPNENKQMHLLLNTVFGKFGFTGSTRDYYHPKNAYLERVIDRRRGLPISLGLIIIFLARRLDLPFYAVNIPIHLLLKFKGKKEEILIDPFDHGKTVTYSQCYYFLKQNGIEPRAGYFDEMGEAAILARLMRNLIRSYRRRELEQKANDLHELLQTLEMICF
jgi:regulator of sirC expression with transglutaminase-like and TPR domain